LKPEQCGSPLVQEKYQEEKACDKRHPYRKIIIILQGLSEYHSFYRREREREIENTEPAIRIC